ASGVDRALSFRHLFVLRPGDPPSGPKTKLLVQKFLQAGGRFIAPTEGDLRAFVALHSMRERNLDGFEAWLRASKPLFDTALFNAADLSPPRFLQQPEADTEKPELSESSRAIASPPLSRANRLPTEPTKVVPAAGR